MNAPETFCFKSEISVLVMFFFNGRYDPVVFYVHFEALLNKTSQSRVLHPEKEN